MSSEPLHLDCRTFPPNRRADEIIPNDERNLVWRAVLAVRRIRELPVGLRVTLFKRIPSQAGSGAVRATPRQCCCYSTKHLALGLNQRELWDLASNLGSDVPFFLLPLAQIARGRGEILVPIEGLPRLHCVVIAPPVGLSTPAVYGRSKVPDRPQSLEPLLAALRFGATSLSGMLWNSLEPAARELSSEIDRLAAIVKNTAPQGQLMSGSGSSYFALYGSARAAAHAANYLAGLSLGRVFLVNTIS